MTSKSSSKALRRPTMSAARAAAFESSPHPSFTSSSTLISYVIAGVAMSMSDFLSTLGQV